MSGRRRQRDNLAPSLFPFLAVLLCTMGALVLILMLIVAGAQSSVQQVADQTQNQMEEAEAMLQLAKNSYERQLTEGRLALEKKRLALQSIENHVQDLLAELADLKRTADLIEQEKSDDDAEQQDHQAAISELEKQLADANAELLKKVDKPDGDKPIFAIIPYQGSKGTHRRPIYLECVADGIILQPEGIRITPSDLKPPYGPGNPLDAALRTVRAEFPPSNGAVTSTAYPLLVVRPSGIRAYTLARAAMSGWDDQFGYELVSEKLELAFPDSVPGLKNKLVKAIDLARERQAALVMAMPNQYRQSNADRYADEQGMGGEWEAGNTGASGGSGGSVGAPGSGSAPGSNVGMPGGFSLAGNPESMFGEALASSSERGSEYGFGSENGAGGGEQESAAQREGGSWSSSDGSSGLRPSGGGAVGGAGSGNATPGGNNTGSGEQSSASQSGGADGAATFGGASSGGSAAGQMQMSPGSTAMQGPSGSSSGNGGSQSASNSSGQATSEQTTGQSAPSNSSNVNATEQVNASPQLSMNKDFSRNKNESAPPVARSRGRDWAWSQGPPTETPVVRSIRLQCWNDRWVVLPDNGSSGQPVMISFDLPPKERAEKLAHVVLDRVDSWGLALSGGYWKPVLSVEVAADAQWRYDQLQQLLEGSGLEVQLRPPGNTPRKR